MAQKSSIDEIKSAVNKSTGLSAFNKKKSTSQQKTVVKNRVTNTSKRTDDEIIKEYESIPNRNILSRGFSGISTPGAGRPATQAETDYNRKQELYKDYRQAKNRQISSFIADNNISEASLTNAKSYNDVAHPDSLFKGAIMPSAIVGSYDYDNIKKLADANGIDMKDILEYKESTAAQKAKEENTKYADEHGVIGTLATVPLNIYGSAANLIDNTGNWLSGNPIGSNETINAFSDTAMSMRNAVSENIDSPVGKFMYNVGTSIADNVALMPLGPGISLAGMGAEAASSTLNDMKDKNVTPNQMMGTAATSGLIEVLTEKIPLDNLFKIARTQGRQTAREIILNVLKNAGAEGVGEGISEIANSIADYAINQDESEWSQLVKYYESLGMTKSQAENQAYLQFGLNAVQASAAGAVSGGLMAGGASVFANANSNIITPEQFQANEEYIQKLKNINEGNNYLDSYNDRVAQDNAAKLEPLNQNYNSSQEKSVTYEKMLERVKAVPRTSSDNNVINEINLTSSPDMGPLPTADTHFSTDTGNVPAVTGDSSSLFNNSISNPSENVNENQKKRSYNDTFVEKTDAPQKLKNEFIENPDMYTAISNADTKAKADAILNENSTDSALTKFRQLLDSKSPEAVPLGYSLSKKLYQKGRIDESVQLVRDMSRALTEAGQFSQAAAITMLNNDPEAAKRYIIRELDSLNQKGREKYGKKWTDFELTDAELQRFDRIEPGDTDSIKSVYQSIYNRISKQYPSTMTEKLLEYRRVSMLLNVRTNVRNVVSNALLYPVRWTADRVSALGEGVYSLIDPKYQRTQSMNPIRSKRAKQLASEAFEMVRTELLGDNKYEDSKGAIRDRQVFKGTKLSKMLDTVTNGAITKANQLMGKDVNPSLMETARNFTYWLLEKGDDVFVKKNFESRMASYIDAQGITDIENIPADAYVLATQEALKATFKDDSALANTMSSFRQLLNRLPGHFVGDAIIPFSKTPANLAMRGIDYSPAGVYNGIKTLENAKSNVDIAKGITQLGQSATGTAAIALGYVLAGAGIISGALSDDKDEAQFQKQQGQLAYSIKTPFGYLSYDWAQPASIPIILGVTIYDSVNNDGDFVNGLKNGFLASVDSWLELSPLQNLSDIFGGYGSPAENVWDVLSTDLPLSFISSQVGAAARIGDTTQRVTYDQNSYWNNLLNQAKAKIPGLSETLPVAYDTWGNPIKRQDSTAEAAFANLMNPGQFGNSNVTPIDGEISRLYDSTGDSAIFPRKADWSTNISGENVKLNNNQYSEYQRIMGENSFDMASALIESSAYNSLSDEQRVKAISEMYSFASALAKSDVLGYDVEKSNTYKKTYSIYKEKGAEGAAIYLGIKQNQEGTKLTDKFSAVDSLDLSDDDKGYYLSKMVDVSNAASSIQSEYGYAGLYTWYSMRSKVDKDSDMPYQIVKSGMPYEDMLNYASVLYEDGKKKTAREKAADALQEVQNNLTYYRMLERVQAVPRTNSPLTPLGNSAYEEMLKRVQSVPR